MKVKLPTEEKPADERVDGPEDDPSRDDLPAEETTTEENPVTEDDSAEQDEPARITEADLKVARLEGELEGLRKAQSKPAGATQEERDTAVRQQCVADINALDDDSFTQKYRMTKLQANNAIHEYDRNKEKTQNAVRIAELEAKNDLIAKYPSIQKHFDKIKQTVKEELSLEAQQDPERLRRAMEKEFLLIEKASKTEPAKKKTQEDPMRRRIVNDDFHKPNQDPNRGKDKKDSDELAPELVEVGRRFGITTESQRKKFMSPYIPMDLGGGYKFEDPKKGFEKVANK